MFGYFRYNPAPDRRPGGLLVRGTMESKMQCEEIETLISGGLTCASVKVLSDDGTHFEALVISQEFEGQARIRRHQMIYATLGALMGREIHAMSIQAMTPQELAARGPGKEQD